MGIGRQIRSWGRGSGRNRVAVCVLVASLLFLLGVATAQQAPPTEASPSKPPQPLLPADSDAQAAMRDSLRREIQIYSRAISGLRDSLSLDELDIQLSEEQRARLQETVQDFTDVIEGIGQELGEMELQISNNRISFLDRTGEGIVIDVPQNLDKQISQGFQLLQEVILKDMPEETRQEVRRSWSWGVPGREEKFPERQIVRGNVVKIREGVQIPANQDVRGNVVVVFGDAQISGRVDGKVVTVFGDLVIDDTAEITDEVITVAGFLSQDPGADVSDVTVIDPLPGLTDGDFRWLTEGGALGLFAALGELMLILVLALIGMALTPRENLERVHETLTTRPLPSLLVGAVGSLVLVLLGLALIGILVLTVIGIPVALLVLVGLLLVGVLSISLVGVVLGRRICQLVSGSCGNEWLVLVLGVVLLDSISLLGHLAGLIPGFGGGSQGLIIIGAGLKLAAFLYGIGGLLLGRFGRNR